MIVLAASSRNKNVALRVALMASASLLAIEFPALAQDATWLAAPSSGNYRDSANWSGGTVPTGSATFSASDATTVRISTGTVGGWTFDGNASDYSFDLGTFDRFYFNGAGIVIDGGSAIINNGGNLDFENASSANFATIYNSRILYFWDASTAGNAIITNGPTFGSSLDFIDNSTAGNATITNYSGMTFFDNSTAGNAVITNDGHVYFRATSTADTATIDNNLNMEFHANSRAGNASITNDDTLIFRFASTADSATIDNNGTVTFLENGTAGNARLINRDGATIDFSGSSGPNGDNRLSAGSIEGAGSFLLGTNELTVGSNNRSTELGGNISGVGGSMRKIGTGTLTLSGNASSLTGPTSIAEGTLAVTGELGGTLNVSSAGRLQGTGTVGGTTIGAGGMIEPGNSIGTLHIAGDYTQQAGSVYQVEIAPDGSSDLIDITGEARIEGGTVFALKAPGEYDLGTRYTILSAAGGVTGAFDAVDQNAPFIDLLLAYDPGNVYLDVARNDVSFCDVAATANQCAVANGAESLGAGNPIHDAIASATDANAARTAFDALSGEIHASTGTALVQGSQHVRDAVNDRVRAAFAAIDAANSATWGSAFGSWGNAAALTHATGGILAGVDGLVTPDWQLGFMAGYSHSAFDADGRSSSGSSDNYHLGLYGGTQSGALSLRAGAAYAWHDIATRRAVAFPGFADNLSAEYGAGTFQAFSELGYRIDAPGVSIEPFANLAYVNFRADGFTETGGAAALASVGQSSDTMFTTIGVRASTDFDLGTAKATARGMIGWRHAYGDIEPTSAHAFAGGDAFTVAGVPIAEDTTIVEAGLDFAISPAATFGLSYTGEFGSGSHDSNARVNFSVRF